MNASKLQSTALAGALIGILTLITYFLPENNNWVLELIGSVITALGVGAIVGYLFRKSIDNPYLVAIFTSIMVYASMRLYGFVDTFIVLKVLNIGVAIILFMLADKMFNSVRLPKKYQVPVGVGIVVVWFVVASVLGLYLARLYS